MHEKSPATGAYALHEVPVTSRLVERALPEKPLTWGDAPYPETAKSARCTHYTFDSQRPFGDAPNLDRAADSKA